MGFGQVFDNQTSKRMDALGEKFSLSSIIFSTTVFGYMQF